jgi:4-hydroxy-tetrahydrodipicolinate synthase
MTLDGSDTLSGAYVPLVVPFDGGAVDFDAYARLCEWQIGKGINGLLVNATSGEPTTLTREERARLVDVAQDVAAGRCPVCAGTASQSHAETVALIDHYQKRGVDSVFVVTPYYCKPPQRALVEFFADVAQRTDRPLLIYHIPGRAAVRLTADTIVAIKDRAENFIGLKNTDDNLGLVTEVLQRLGGDFRIFCGWEPVTLPMLAIGACGAMLSASNVVPDRVAQLCGLSAKDDFEGARRLNGSLSELFAAIDYDTSPIATKYMLKRIGALEKNEHRLPMTSASPELERRLDAVLGRAGLI